MKIVMTLLARDEADVVDANIAYHLNVGVDLVVATDNRSEDGTTEILESYARDGYVHLLREEGEDMRQGEWVTRMARLAASEHEADWVLNTDADEFWWPRVGSLKEVLVTIPPRFATVRAFLRNFAPRTGNAATFAERMTARLTPSALDRASPFRAHPFQPQDKVLHRAHPRVLISEGNHDARWDGSVDLRGWWPFEVLHFPVRSAEQAAAKRRNWARHGYAPLDELVVGTPGEYYASLEVGDDALVRGVEEGWLVEDTRLRSVLGTLRAPEGGEHQFLLPSERTGALELPAPTLSEMGALAGDVTAGSVRDSVQRTYERIEALDARLGSLERPPWRRVTGVARARSGHSGTS